MSDDDVFEEASGVLLNGAAAAARVAETLVRRRQNTAQREADQAGQRTEQLSGRLKAQSDAARRFYAGRGDRDWARTAPAVEVAETWRGAQMWAELDPERFSVHADKVNDSVGAVAGTDPRAAVTATGVNVADAVPTVAGLVERERAERERTKAGQEEEVARDARQDQDADLARAGVASDPYEADQARETAEERGDVAVTAGAAAETSFAAAEISEDLAYDSDERRNATAEALRTAGVPEQAVTAKMTADHLNGQHPRKAARSAGKVPTKRPARGRGQAAERGRDSGLSR